MTAASPDPMSSRLVALSELAEDAMFSISDLFDDDALDAIEERSDLDKVRLRYTSADCDDFALAMHAVTGWPIVAVTSGRKGPLHRLVRVPDDGTIDGGKFVDVMGFVNEADLRKRYKAKDLRFVEASESDSSIGDDDELSRVVAVMTHLPEAPSPRRSSRPMSQPGCTAVRTSMVHPGPFAGSDLAVAG